MLKMSRRWRIDGNSLKRFWKVPFKGLCRRRIVDPSESSILSSKTFWLKTSFKRTLHCGQLDRSLNLNRCTLIFHLTSGKHRLSTAWILSKRSEWSKDFAGSTRRTSCESTAIWWMKRHFVLIWVSIMSSIMSSSTWQFVHSLNSIQGFLFKVHR